MFAPGIRIEFSFGFPTGKVDSGFDYTNTVWTIAFVTENSSKTVILPGSLTVDEVAGRVTELDAIMRVRHEKPIISTILAPTEKRDRVKIELDRAFFNFHTSEINKLATALAERL